MTNNPLIPQSKLPQLGTTTFTRMSTPAQQHQAINLSQGFPDFDDPRYLQRQLTYHVAQGTNQYTPMTGMQTLREAITQKTERLYGYQPDVNNSITITAGATEALYVAIAALVCNGGEMICFNPSYDSCTPVTALSGGVVRHIALQPPHFHVDWQEFTTLSSKRTRLVIPNIPHNPNTTAWRQTGLAALWQAIAGYEIFVISNEVYEHINFSQQGHASVLVHPQLRERMMAVPSSGGAYHMADWKAGYYVTPAPISAEICKMRQYLTFSVNTPTQLASAGMLRTGLEHYLALPDFHCQKRGIPVSALSESRLEVLSCRGTHFLLMGYSAVSTLDDVEFCQWLTRKHGIVVIPLLVFCADPFLHELIRLCFTKKESTLLAAAEHLHQPQLFNRPGAEKLTAGKQLLRAVNLLQAQRFAAVHSQLSANFIIVPSQLAKFLNGF